MLEVARFRYRNAHAGIIYQFIKDCYRSELSY